MKWIGFFALFLGAGLLTFGFPQSLDARLFYTSQEAQLLLQSLDSEQSQHYLLTGLADFLFLFSYSLWLFLLARQLKVSWPLLILIPSPGFFDALETGLIVSALLGEATAIHFNTLPLITLIKWGLSPIPLAFCVLAGTSLWWKKR